MATKNTTLYFGIIGGISAFVLGYLNIGFHLVYLPSITAAVVTIILFTRKIDLLKRKNRRTLNSIFFGIFIAISTLFLAAVAGSSVLFFMSLIEYYHPEIFKVGLNYFESGTSSFKDYFLEEGIKYLLAPMVWVLLGGFIPCLIFGSLYGVIRSKQQ